MRMNVEFKPPRIFSRKSKLEIDDDVDVNMGDKKVSGVTLIGTTLLIGVTAGYLVGFNRGVNKNANVYIIK